MAADNGVVDEVQLVGFCGGIFDPRIVRVASPDWHMRTAGLYEAERPD